MDKYRNRLQVILASITVIAVLISIIALSYAWFSFNSAPYVEPMEQGSTKVHDGDSGLQIANTAEGPFETECALTFTAKPDTIRPVSTADLSNFYQTSAQNRNGISILYKDVTTNRDQYVINGTLYLKSTGANYRIYFLPSAFTLGSDVQSMSAMRLGMRFTVDDQEQTYLFRLDGRLSGTPESKLTVPTEGTVVNTVNGSGVASYTTDPSVDISDYMAVENGSDLQAGTSVLCNLNDEQVATVQFWIYLEGCDVNCLNSVQSKDIPIQFGFAGVPGGTS